MMNALRTAVAGKLCTRLSSQFVSNSTDLAIQTCSVANSAAASAACWRSWRVSKWTRTLVSTAIMASLDLSRDTAIHLPNALGLAHLIQTTKHVLKPGFGKPLERAQQNPLRRLLHSESCSRPRPAYSGRSWEE